MYRKETVMFFSFDLSTKHHVVSANTHYYEKPTAPLYINRVLEYHDLIYLVEGQWIITENETDYLLGKDDVLLLSAGYHHYTRLPCAPETRTMCIHITHEKSDNFSNKDTLLLPPCIHTHDSHLVRRYFESIVSVFWSDKPYKQERMSALLDVLMLQLFDANDSDVQQKSEFVRDIVQMLVDKPHVRYSCTDIANAFSVSTKTVENAMVRATGMSFSKYQNQKKVEMIISQMRVEPDLRLSELADMFGFCDEFHLSKVFKQTYGMSPSAYKKAILQSK